MTTPLVDRLRVLLLDEATANELRQFAAAVGMSTEDVVAEITRTLDWIERNERIARDRELLREFAHPSTPYVEEFRRHTKQVAEEKKVAYRAHRQALVERERAGTPPLSARQYPRPIRKGRACGSGWRVRL